MSSRTKKVIDIQEDRCSFQTAAKGDGERTKLSPRHLVDEECGQQTSSESQGRKLEPKLLSLKSWLVAILVLLVVVVVMGAIHLGLTVRGKGQVVGAHSLGLEENQKTSKLAAQSSQASQKQKKTPKKQKNPKKPKNLKRSQSLKTHSKRFFQIFWIKS